MPTIDKIIRTKRKTIALIVESNGDVIIRAPKRATKREINALVKKHAKWIAKKQAEAHKKQEAFAPRRFEEGEEFYFYYLLEFIQKEEYMQIHYEQHKFT